jgi:hypothetical protein
MSIQVLLPLAITWLRFLKSPGERMTFDLTSSVRLSTILVLIKDFMFLVALPSNGRVVVSP